MDDVLKNHIRYSLKAAEAEGRAGHDSWYLVTLAEDLADVTEDPALAARLRSASRAYSAELLQGGPVANKAIDATREKSLPELFREISA